MDSESYAPRRQVFDLNGGVADGLLASGGVAQRECLWTRNRIWAAAPLKLRGVFAHDTHSAQFTCSASSPYTISDLRIAVMSGWCVGVADFVLALRGKNVNIKLCKGRIRSQGAAPRQSRLMCIWHCLSAYYGESTGLGGASSATGTALMQSCKAWPKVRSLNINVHALELVATHVSITHASAMRCGRNITAFE